MIEYIQGLEWRADLLEHCLFSKYVFPAELLLCPKDCIIFIENISTLLLLFIPSIIVVIFFPFRVKSKISILSRLFHLNLIKIQPSHSNIIPLINFISESPIIISRPVYKNWTRTEEGKRDVVSRLKGLNMKTVPELGETLK